jgi:predicted Zn-dependent protease
VAGAGYIASYGRDQERQADEVGQRLAADAGYAPDGISRFLLTLQREERLRKPGREPGPAFLDSHPATEERVEATLARARSLRVAPDAPLSPDASAFLGRLEGLTVGADPADGVFVGDRFLHPVLDFSIEFPAGWHARNQRHAVLAAPSAGDALLQLEEEAAALDPSRLARDFLAQNRLEPQQPRSLRIGGFPAYRALAEAQGPQGPLGLDLTWIALPRGALRLIGVAPLHRFAAHAGRLAATAQSLRALTPEDRARIRGRRLHIVRAEPGETLIALARRAGNRWSVEETAVANGLEPTTPLAAGRPIKTVVERPYP